MKFNKFVGTAGLGALSVALLSTSALAQSTPLNVPKSVDAYREAAEGSEPCTETYEKWLNREQCLAQAQAEEHEDGDLATAQQGLTDAQIAYDEDVALKQADLDAKKLLEAEAKKNNEEAVAARDAIKLNIVDEEKKTEVLALAVNSAEKALVAKATAQGLSVADYADPNGDFADDPDVIAYNTAKSDYDEQLLALQAAREPLVTAEGEVTSTQDLLEEASRDVAAVDLSPDQAVVDALNDAKATLKNEEEIQAGYVEAASKPLAPGEDPNYDLLTDPKNANNPAKAVLAAAECVANPDSEACVEAATLIGKDDVGQAIVDGFDQLYDADATLQTNIDKETADRKAADTTLQKNIDTEVADRKAADVVLQANIDKEVTDRKAADVVLQQNIDKEVTDRKAADTTLQNNINAEVAARTAADVTLQNNINTVNTRVTQLGERVDSLTKESRQGIAMAMALAAIPTVNYGKFSLGLGVGTFASETAAALGMDFVVSERVKFKLGVTTTGDETGGSAGIAIGF